MKGLLACSQLVKGASILNVPVLIAIGLPIGENDIGRSTCEFLSSHTTKPLEIGHMRQKAMLRTIDELDAGHVSVFDRIPAATCQANVFCKRKEEERKRGPFVSHFIFFLFSLVSISLGGFRFHFSALFDAVLFALLPVERVCGRPTT